MFSFHNACVFSAMRWLMIHPERLELIFEATHYVARPVKSLGFLESTRLVSSKLFVLFFGVVFFLGIGSTAIDKSVEGLIHEQIIPLLVILSMASIKIDR